MEIALIEQMSFMIGDWIPEEAAIAMVMGGHYVYIKEGAQELKIRPGDAVHPGSIAEMVIKQERKIEKQVEASVWGSAFYGIGYPVEIHGEKAVLVIVLPADYWAQKKQPLYFLTGKLEDSWRPMPIERVSHIESSQKKTWFVADEEMFCSIHTLKSLKNQLPDTFLQIHRSYIVNVNYIEEISRDITSSYILIMKDGSILPVSQNYSLPMREKLGF